MAKAAGPEPEPEPEPEPPQNTDVAASKAKTRGALLGGLRSGALEAAVAKMEEDTADSTPPIAGSAWVDAGLEGSPMVAGLQRELAELKIGQLRRRAVEAGLEEAAVDDALDSDTPREAVIALVVARVANEPVIKQGKLGKEGSGKGLFHSVNNVNHRFFDLDGMFLCYYQSASSGSVRLPNASTCIPSLAHIQLACSCRFYLRLPLAARRSSSYTRSSLFLEGARAEMFTSRFLFASYQKGRVALVYRRGEFCVDGTSTNPRGFPCLSAVVSLYTHSTTQRARMHACTHAHRRVHLGLRSKLHTQTHRTMRTTRAHLSQPPCRYTAMCWLTRQLTQRFFLAILSVCINAVGSCRQSASSSLRSPDAPPRRPAERRSTAIHILSLWSLNGEHFI